MAPPEEYSSPYEDNTEAIPDGGIVYRRVTPDNIDWSHTTDGSTRDKGADLPPRLKSGACQDYGEVKAAELGYPGPAMSVASAAKLEESGLGPEQLVAGYGASYGVVAFTAADLRVEQQGIMLWPTEKEPWHSIVFSMVQKKKSGGVQSRLAAVAAWVIVPPEP
jgi:hypothetical protein